MILGDPYKFAICANVISEWNEDDKVFNNGVLLICIDGEFFPKQVFNATLNYEIPMLVENLMNLTINSELFKMEKDKAFIKMYNITFPEWEPEWDSEKSIDNDYCYLLSPSVLSDTGCYIFAVSNGNQIRIMGSMLNYDMKESTHILNDIEVIEAFITYGELNKIISGLEGIL